MRTFSLSLALFLSVLPSGHSEGEPCDLSLFRNLPPVFMRTFQLFRDHYVRIHDPSYAEPLIISLEELRALKVPERNVLVWAEMDCFSSVLGNLTEPALGVMGRKARNSLLFVTIKLSNCVLDDGFRKEEYSKQLTLYLQALKDLKASPEASVNQVVLGLTQLLNEHLTCAARGSSC